MQTRDPGLHGLWLQRYREGSLEVARRHRKGGVGKPSFLTQDQKAQVATPPPVEPGQDLAAPAGPGATAGGGSPAGSGPGQADHGLWAPPAWSEALGLDRGPAGKWLSDTPALRITGGWRPRAGREWASGRAEGKFVPALRVAERGNGVRYVLPLSGQAPRQLIVRQI